MSDPVLQQRPPREPLVPPGGYELLARDMTATFSADCTLRFAQEQLGEIGQWLPVDGDPDATLGSLIESNSTGPLRLGFGAWRDLLLGAQFTNGRLVEGKGELISAGGRTVKNVAGYDLTKFIVGQFGIFGRLITFTTRTYRKPDGGVLARFAPDPTKLAAMLPTPLRPQWALLTREHLHGGYLGDETTLTWYASNVGTVGPQEVSRRSLAEDIEHRGSLWRTDGGPLSFRASVPPSELARLVPGMGEIRWAADPAFGILVGTVPDHAERVRLKGAITVVGGTARFGAGPDDVDFSTNPGERQIIERLKTAFDPDNRLNPLPWQRR
jgi:FAD/FMN-containing dehydrogenase